MFISLTCCSFSFIERWFIQSSSFPLYLLILVISQRITSSGFLQPSPPPTHAEILRLVLLLMPPPVSLCYCTLMCSPWYEQHFRLPFVLLYFQRWSVAKSARRVFQGIVSVTKSPHPAVINWELCSICKLEVSEWSVKDAGGQKDTLHMQWFLEEKKRFATNLRPK